MPASSRQFDLVLVGAGIFGLASACEALRQGQKVAVIEAETVGAGSSGGLLGALMPHMPARWNPKKAFQFEALQTLESHAAEIEVQSGVTTGYRRCGRILPLTSEDRLAHHKEREQESLIRWQPEHTGFHYKVEPAGSRSDWLAAEAAPFGLVHETLAARIDPRAYLNALATLVRQKGALLEHAAFEAFDAQSGRVTLAGAEEDIFAGQLVLACGHHSFPLIEKLIGQSVGRGEKGQALLLEGKGLEQRPAIYCDGLYVVPHDNGTVAVGSTSDGEFVDAAIDPRRTAELLERACAFCPSLKGRQVLDVWAGIRPRSFRRDPLVGRLPGQERVWVATGGFKISFGIAHLIAKALMGEMGGCETAPSLPETFRPPHHFAA